MATGGVDNKVVVWNSLTGTVRQVHKMPRRDDNPNVYVTQVKFVNKTSTSTKAGADSKEENVSDMMLMYILESAALCHAK